MWLFHGPAALLSGGHLGRVHFFGYKQGCKARPCEHVRYGVQGGVRERTCCPPQPDGPPLDCCPRRAVVDPGGVREGLVPSSGASRLLSVRFLGERERACRTFHVLGLTAAFFSISQLLLCRRWCTLTKPSFSPSKTSRPSKSSPQGRRLTEGGKQPLWRHCFCGCRRHLPKRSCEITELLQMVSGKNVG